MQMQTRVETNAESDADPESDAFGADSLLETEAEAPKKKSDKAKANSGGKKEKQSKKQQKKTAVAPPAQARAKKQAKAPAAAARARPTKAQAKAKSPPAPPKKAGQKKKKKTPAQPPKARKTTPTKSQKTATTVQTSRGQSKDPKATKKTPAAGKPKATKAKKAVKSPKAKAKGKAKAKAPAKAAKAAKATKATKAKSKTPTKATKSKATKAKSTPKQTKAKAAKPAKARDLVEAVVKGEDDDGVEDFPTFAVKYNRKYKSATHEAKRRAAYEANMKEVKRRRASGPKAKTKAKPSQSSRLAVDPEGPAVFGATPFSDLTPAEFRARFLGAASAAKVSTSVKEKSKARAAKLSPAVVRNMAKAIVPKASSPIAKKKKISKKSKARFAQRALQPMHDALLESEVVGPPAKKPTPPPPPPPKDASVYAGAMGGQHGEPWTANITLTAAEIAALRAQAKLVVKPKVRPSGNYVDAPVDYRDHSPVIRFTQGCAACWAAVTADLLQATYYRHTGRATSQLSAQGIVDCVVTTYDWGCGGGSVMTAINSLVDTAVAAKQNSGFLYREQDYPWRYNMRADAKPVCRAKGLQTFPVVSAWSWAMFPAVSPIIDVTGMQAAFDHFAKDFAKMQQAPVIQAEIAALNAQIAGVYAAAQKEADAISARVQAARDEADRSVAAIDAETKRIERVKDDAAKALTQARAVTGPTRDQRVREADDAYTAANQAHSARIQSAKALKDAVLAQLDTLGPQRDAVFARANEKAAALGKEVAAKADSLNGNMQDLSQLMDSWAGNSQRSYMSPSSSAFGELSSKADGREIALARVLNAFGPVAVILDASGLQNYRGGIYDGSACSNAPTAGNHAALLVGLGVDKKGKQYWIVKNSWGSQWGNGGYLHMYRGGNLCGLTNGVVRANAAGDANDPAAVLQDRAISEFLAGRPSSYVPRV